MVYVITGLLKGKRYKSRKKFNSEKSALSWAYKNLVYNPSGDTKRKYSLSGINVIKL